MISPGDVVPHELEDSAHGLTDDGASEVTDVHLFGDVGG